MRSAVLEAILPEIEQRLARQVSELRLPGAAAGIVNGQELVWSQGFGCADIASQRRPDADTVYRVGSITKTFTAAALVQLCDQGKLSLDDPLVRHIPEFAVVDAQHGTVEAVTLRRLLTHRSGLMGEPPTGHWETLEFPSVAEIVAALPRVSIVIEPDAAFKYSNLGFTLLGEVVTRVSRQSYVEYVREHILEPLGMRSSSFALADATGTRMATGYDPSLYSDELTPSAHPDIKGMAAAGQLYSTVNDLARWIALQFREDAPTRGGVQVLSGRSLREMHRPVYMEPGWGSGFCLSWMATRRGDNIYLGHGGGIHGFTTQILFNLEHSVGAIVLLNSIGSPQELAIELLEAILKAEKDAPKPLPEMPRAPMPAGWRPFLGRYIGPLGWPAQVEFRDGGLIFAAPPQPPTHLEATDEPHIFLAKDQRYAGEPLTFRLTAESAVTGFDVSGFAFRKLIEAQA